MMAARVSWRARLAGAVCFGAMVCALVLLAAPALGASGYARVRPACGAAGPGEATCFALVRVRVPASQAAQPGVRPLAARPAAAPEGPAGGLTPADLASAYGFDPSASGTGQTIGIVDAFDDPNIEGDLEKFDTEYGLPACTTGNGCFRKVGPTGSASELPAADTKGWSVEISLDVEMAHAACQKCHILLVEGENAQRLTLAKATKKAEELGATIVSNSYGAPELAGEPSKEETAPYNDPGVVVAAATGDFGYDWWDGPLPNPESANVPAALPSVVSVGGTSLSLNAKAERASETVWNGNGRLNEREFSEGATGGGCSKFFNAQPWQQDVAGFSATGCGTKRLAADVAADADPFTGLDIFDSYDCGEHCEPVHEGVHWFTIGGTSLSTPLIAGLYGLAGGAQGLNYPALILYGHLGDSSVFDVTQGGNGYCDDGGKACGINAIEHERLDCEGTTACNAATGFDGPSGVGTPRGLSLFKPRLPAAAIKPPGSVVAGTAATFGGSGSSDPNPGATLTYAWTFGDGGSASGVSPSHTYAAPGEYTIGLTVTDSYGLKSPAATTSVIVSGHTKKEIEEEEAALKKKHEEEEAKAHEKEVEEKTHKEEEALKKKHEEEAEKKAKEEAAKKAAEEAAKKAAAEAAAKRLAEELALKAKAAAEALTPPIGGAAPQGQQSVSPFKAAATPDAVLVHRALRARARGLLTVTISCPQEETSCTGVVTLRSHGMTLASGHFKAPGGKTVAVRLHLGHRALALLARKHRLPVRVTIAAADPAGATHTSSVAATLRGSGH
jgi:PKD repeat protein